jgi:heme-degrading monooxygenase HmoA
MKKGLIIALIIILGAVGYLAYDWHVKTKILEDDQRVTLYSWTDEKDTKHYTNTQPTDGVRNVEENKGYEYSDRPLVIKLKDKVVDGYKGLKEKLFRKKNRKKDKR